MHGVDIMNLIHLMKMELLALIHITIICILQQVLVVTVSTLLYSTYIRCNFSVLGIQQSPAVGRAVSEMILDGGFKTIDLTRLGFDRILLDKPIREQNCF